MSSLTFIWYLRAVVVPAGEKVAERAGAPGEPFDYEWVGALKQSSQV